MKRIALLKHLTQCGCVYEREGGDHSIWLNPQSGKQSSVPRHREIKKRSLSK
ncbi:type II toxin-antitoxin system HicA family toxin [Planctomicrobium sp. SH661]|uniref:type II toxin-antitoxin system HicA family toxin n=1 Tax=Planctomicrobium sp. SH661 TaxID=3448124 RepID=UPI003F5B24BB